MRVCSTLYEYYATRPVSVLGASDASDMTTAGNIYSSSVGKKRRLLPLTLSSTEKSDRVAVGGKTGHTGVVEEKGDGGGGEEGHILRGGNAYAMGVCTYSFIDAKQDNSLHLNDVESV